MQLQHREPSAAVCKTCGIQAVGPCARCHDPVCGECCVLTEGGAKTWAICLDCEGRAGKELTSSWWAVAKWIGGPIAILAVLVLLLEILFR